MAIEIIRAGTRRQVECGNCGALLRYSPEDVSHRTGSTYEPPRFTTAWIAGETPA